MCVDSPSRDTLPLSTESRCDVGPLALLVAAPGAPIRLIAPGPRGLVVGSGRSCDLRVTSPYLSRRHCRLGPVRDDRISVTDLGSRNGTFVDGEPVSRVAAGSGALLSMGDLTATVVRTIPSPWDDTVAHGWPHQGFVFEEMLGACQVSMDTCHGLNRLAASSQPILVTGESGTGKELAARALHRRSTRRDGPFEVVNCGALPAGLAEAELFGWRRGAFTGATRDNSGAFLRAAGGTLFLDEVGELPLELQPKLLRVLENGEVRQLGDGRTQRVDVRLVSATNRELQALVACGRFRADLHYRIDGARLHIPPLRARRDDVPLMAASVLAREHGRHLSPEAAAWLREQEWRGNVRELRHFLARVGALGGPGNVTRKTLLTSSSLVSAPQGAGADVLPFDELQDAVILRALAAHDGRRSATMRALQIPRSTFYKRLRRLRARGLAIPPAPASASADEAR